MADANKQLTAEQQAELQKKAQAVLQKHGAGVLAFMRELADLGIEEIGMDNPIGELIFRKRKGTSMDTAPHTTSL